MLSDYSHRIGSSSASVVGSVVSSDCDDIACGDIVTLFVCDRRLDGCDLDGLHSDDHHVDWCCLSDDCQ